MTPSWHWTLNIDKYSVCTQRFTSEAENSICFALRTLVFEIQGCRKSEMHRMTPNWTSILNNQKYFIYTKYLPPEAQMLVRFALRSAVFKIQDRRKPEMHQMAQTEFEHLTVKGTLYTLNTYPWSPHFSLFCSTNSRFRDARSSTIWNAPNDPKLNLNT